jgi:hypothetical protein
MSRLVAFYRGIGTDSEGRTLSEIWAYSDEQLEEVHDFIQWLFPLRERSNYNADAPLLTDAEIAEFRADAGLKANLRRSFDVYLTFLGLRHEGDRVVEGEDFDRRGVFQYPDHNWLRITRVLTSTRLLGLEEESRAFFAFLKGLKEGGRSGITNETFRYWQAAAPPAPR